MRSGRTWGVGDVAVRLRLRFRTGRSGSLGAILGVGSGTRSGIGTGANVGRSLLGIVGLGLAGISFRPVPPMGIGIPKGAVPAGLGLVVIGAVPGVTDNWVTLSLKGNEPGKPTIGRSSIV